MKKCDAIAAAGAELATANAAVLQATQNLEAAIALVDDPTGFRVISVYDSTCIELGCDPLPDGHGVQIEYVGAEGNPDGPQSPLEIPTHAPDANGVMATIVLNQPPGAVILLRCRWVRWADSQTSDPVEMPFTVPEAA